MEIQKFKVWLQGQVAATGLGDKVICPECDGDGEIITRCDFCDCEKEEHCGLCEGHGFLKFGDVPKTDRAKCFTYDTYLSQLTADIKALQEWTGKDQTFAFNKVDIALAQSVATKRLVLVSMQNNNVKHFLSREAL